MLGFARSPRTTAAWPPLRLIASASCSASAPDRLAWIATEKPALASASVIAPPIRRAAPVMRAARAGLAGIGMIVLAGDTSSPLPALHGYADRRCPCVILVW